MASALGDKPATQSQLGDWLTGMEKIGYGLIAKGAQRRGVQPSFPTTAKTEEAKQDHMNRVQAATGQVFPQSAFPSIPFANKRS